MQYKSYEELKNHILELGAAYGVESSDEFEAIEKIYTNLGLTDKQAKETINKLKQAKAKSLETNGLENSSEFVFEIPKEMV